MNNLFCGNCGKEGHIYRECNKPITSYGIICFRKCIYVSNSIEDKKTEVKPMITNPFGFHPEIILIQRKFTIGYMEFIRGKYDISDYDYILKVFELMTVKEKKEIKTLRDYDKLRQLLGPDRDTPSYRREYQDGKSKFDCLLSSNKLDELINNSLKTSSNWKEPEWGLPKGRRFNEENDIDCAIREFVEETGVSSIKVYENIIPLEEIYLSINGVNYRHIYYIAEYIENPEQKKRLTIDNENPEQCNEISNLRWTGEKKCSYLIRPYYKNKLAIINKAFQIIKNIDTYFE